MRLIEPAWTRFWSKIALPNERGCMLWMGRPSSAGYGRIRIDGELFYAHRISYELAYGEIPAGLEIDHLCRVRHCVAPDHLEVVTHRANMLRGNTPSARHAAKTHCPRGHAYDEANTSYAPNGSRRCRACRRKPWRKRKSQARAAA